MAKPLQASTVTRLRKQGERLSHLLMPGERMRPDYLVIGVKRGGTTSLAEYLLQHPGVIAPYVPKGPRYFDVNHGRGWRWYESHFPRLATARKQAERTGVLPIVGDSSPYIVFHPLSLTWVKAELPDAKLILSLRDPVVRAWSQYNYERKRGYEDLEPDAAFDAEPDRLAGEEDRLRADPSYVSKVHRHNAYLARGHYADQIRHVQSLFAPDQLHVLFAEDLFAAPQAHVRPAHRLPRPGAGAADRPAGASRPTSTSRCPPRWKPAWPAYYAERNEDLFELLGRRAAWIAPRAGTPQAPMRPVS